MLRKFISEDKAIRLTIKTIPKRERLSLKLELTWSQFMVAVVRITFMIAALLI